MDGGTIGQTVGGQIGGASSALVQIGVISPSTHRHTQVALDEAGAAARPKTTTVTDTTLGGLMTQASSGDGHAASHGATESDAIQWHEWAPRCPNMLCLIYLRTTLEHLGMPSFALTEG